MNGGQGGAGSEARERTIKGRGKGAGEKEAGMEPIYALFAGRPSEQLVEVSVRLTASFILQIRHPVMHLICPGLGPSTVRTAIYTTAIKKTHRPSSTREKTLHVAPRDRIVSNLHPTLNVKTTWCPVEEEELHTRMRRNEMKPNQQARLNLDVANPANPVPAPNGSGTTT
jgi:hypothetical protein